MALMLTRKPFTYSASSNFGMGGFRCSSAQRAPVTKDNAQIGGERTDDVRRPACPIGRTVIGIS